MWKGLKSDFGHSDPPLRCGCEGLGQRPEDGLIKDDLGSVPW